MRLRYAVAALCVIAAIVAVTVGRNGHGHPATPDPQQSRPTSPSPGATTATTKPPSALDLEFPPSIRSARMGPTYLRLPVASADLDNMVRVHGPDIVALATKGAFFGQVYAAVSTDGGGAWHIASPQFARAGGCGPCTTNHLNVTTNGTVFAWGNDGDLVKVTTDLGTHWQESDFGHGVVSVTPQGRRLVVRAIGNKTPAGRYATCDYISTDNGLTWQRGPAQPAIKP
ncbi:MAG TPA: hypothetical protein VHV79_08950 [Mycobacteriales bacterium]|jgi:hypothetical protein|nr:hypothetical protein [Mycobacteriales bacterium]